MTIAALQRPSRRTGSASPSTRRCPSAPPSAASLAANAWGPRRTRYGSVRDLVIGVTLVRADGVVAHGGGKVVKNVAGFDLPRLLCGSLGTLGPRRRGGVPAPPAARRRPRPRCFAGLAGVDVRETVPAPARARSSSPTALAAFRTGRPVPARGPLRGLRAGRRATSWRRVLARGAGGARAGSRGARRPRSGPRHDEVRAAGVGAREGDLRAGGAREGASTPSRRSRAALGGARGCVCTPPLGIALRRRRTPAAVEAAAAAVDAARAALRALGDGAVVLAAAPAALRARVDVWGPAPAGVDGDAAAEEPSSIRTGGSRPGRFVGGLIERRMRRRCRGRRSGRSHGGRARRADDCVHCGFCLPTCPTWQNWQEEMDSPRGRIDLFRALEDGRIEMTPGGRRALRPLPRLHGVPDRVPVRRPLRPHHRAAPGPGVEREHLRSGPDRLYRDLVFALFPGPRRLRVGGVLPLALPLTGLPLARAPDRPPPRLPARLARWTPSRRRSRGPTSRARLPARTAARPASGGCGPRSSAAACSGSSSRT